MLPKLAHLKQLFEGKKIHIATHWDCDGVATGGILYHLFKEGPSRVTTISKGDVFLIYPQDCPEDADYIICSDIQPSQELDPNKVIYIDHHPHEFTDNYLMSLHDIDLQSCTLVIWEHLLSETTDSYLIFLTLLGYFGDSGHVNDLPVELYMKAKESFPHLLELRQSQFDNRTYTPLEMYVSLFNTGKRMHWNGKVPLELVKAVTDYKDITLRRHPLVDELERYKIQLRQLYNKKYSFTDTTHFQYSIIECDKNIQGVLCSRYMKEKPVIVCNKRDDKIIASMRVPDDLAFDAGAFLASFKEHAPNVVGGGHEKAGGITFEPQYLPIFIEHLEQSSVSDFTVR